MSRPRLALTATTTAALLLMTAAVTPSLAASTSTECGQLSAYTAPDPVAPADGSLQLGTSPAWDVLAAATVSANATAALPGIVNNAPTCLALGFDGSGKISSIDFAPTGTITGPVTFDSGDGYYLLADRLILPTTIADSAVALQALFETSYQAGTPLTVTFDVDTTTGTFTAFDGHATFCGTASLDSKGDGHVGKAVVLAAALGSTATKNLQKYSGERVCADVHGTGTIADSGSLATSAVTAITLAQAAATPPATTTVASSAAPNADSGIWLVAWLSLLGFVAAVGSFATSRRSRLRR